MDFAKLNGKGALDDIRNIIIVTLVIIEVVGLIVISTLFPIYNLIQANREKILKLFCTFS